MEKLPLKNDLKSKIAVITSAGGVLCGIPAALQTLGFRCGKNRRIYYGTAKIKGYICEY